MGASIMVDGKTATYIGKSSMTGARVKAVDLRGGAAVLIAALAADGVSEITGIDLIRRGYYNIVGKFKDLGADIREESPLFPSAIIN